MNKYETIILLLLFGTACNNHDIREVYHKNRNNVVHVKDKLVDINIDFPDIIGRSGLYIINDYLIIVDHQAHDRGIHLIDKNRFKYLTSTGDTGRGPGEIVYYGHFGADSKNNLLYGIDYGKLELFMFELDSIFEMSYKPKRVLSLNNDLFPASFSFVNDTTIIGNALDIISHNTFKSTVIKMNIRNGDIQKIGVPHPDTDPVKLTTFFAFCEKNYIYTEGYARHDLLTIQSIERDYKINIYGPDWKKVKTRNSYYYIIGIIRDKIIASFDGGDNPFPTRFLIFDLDGNYLTTLETGHGINFFCLDEDNNRIIIYFEDRMNPLAYIDLDGIIN